tara:strand:+ start:3438 stop:3716 length:279 start_codon:yes stop_codon:yes gene_type:complete
MAYSTSNPPFRIAGGIGDTSVWVYKSTDAATAVRVSGYITDGYDLGMRAGDIVIQVDTDATPIASQIMIVTSATSSAVDLSDGTAITATDTD